MELWRCAAEESCFGAALWCRMFFTEHALLPRLLSILEVLSQHTATPRSTEAAAGAASSALPVQQQQQASSQPAGSAAGSATGGAAPSSVRRSTTLMRTGVSPRDPVDTQRVATLRQCVLAVAALLQDDAQKEMVLEGSDRGSGSGSGEPSAVEAASGSQGGCSSSSGVDLILELCQAAEQTGVQGAAYECVAALTTYEPMWQLAKVGVLVAASYAWEAEMKTGKQ